MDKLVFYEPMKNEGRKFSLKFNSKLPYRPFKKIETVYCEFASFLKF